MKNYQVSDIVRIMSENDTRALKKIFRQIKLSPKAKKAIGLLQSERTILNDILTFAAIQSERNSLSKRDEKGWLIIDYVSPVVNLFPLLRALTFYCDFDDDYEIIDPNVTLAINNDQPSDEILEKIENMSSFELFSLIHYISNEVNSIMVTFTLPIIRNIYGNGFISDSLLFALMAANLKPARDVITDPFELILRHAIMQSAASEKNADEEDSDDDDDDDGDDDDAS